MNKGIGVKEDISEFRIDWNLSKQMDPPIFTVANDNGMLLPPWGCGSAVSKSGEEHMR